MTHLVRKLREATSDEEKCLIYFQQGKIVVEFTPSLDGRRKRVACQAEYLYEAANGALDALSAAKKRAAQ